MEIGIGRGTMDIVNGKYLSVVESSGTNIGNAHGIVLFNRKKHL
jgi:hypothetical protein